MALHIVAVPMLPLAVAVVVFRIGGGLASPWLAALLLIAVSYLMQWIGHRLEGNDMGEVILIKRLLGRPYVAVSQGRRIEAPRAGDSAASPDDEAAGTVVKETRPA